MPKGGMRKIVQVIHQGQRLLQDKRTLWIECFWICVRWELVTLERVLSDE